MPILPFSKWSPGGNTTVFLPATEGGSPIAAVSAFRAMDARYLNAEQAAFVDVAGRHMRMAGGEFCVNAARAFGARLDLEALSRNRDGQVPEERAYEASVSGWTTPVNLLVRGGDPEWDVTARLLLPDCPVEHPAQGIGIVRLPGITHLLVDTTVHPLPGDCVAAGDELRKRHDLEREDASGIVWWRMHGGMPKMVPLVYVRDAGTTCMESSCGSGALALAMHLAAGAPDPGGVPMLQPSGALLHVRLHRDECGPMADIGGSVTLIARGRLWLPQP
ncbi:MAG: hypothetical protein LBR22_08380 [Desulfovibrio sp.]|jgi:diaminopimelate epimerase|nr:hypothetical protein [Desulfovibrio sp.]